MKCDDVTFMEMILCMCRQVTEFTEMKGSAVGSTGVPWLTTNFVCFVN